ncbi:transcription initiation factor TFIID subunit 8-like isoform X1 [Salvia hispanica]|uniref:transcription initiation factor TFIID subunit 8-like isoform X1 n=1 Tax=Salvia hispanica TaxID=49212 RepID=UPI002009A2BA|nr:transcription initiation factor TFIID subunit 8-like isoform X1 [Salvia hispanica]XP_047942228.1 transcription initiation factor TFIID subunit 8-like isoform X1 [Salvia hispanica]XP_047942229.1 transcription initiation factor TFIID subunit 8-like isoform X1 [Salvia hispanica]
MSHGEGKDKFFGEKENLQSTRKKKKLGKDEFTQAIARNVVAQVCESLGFQSFQQSALDNLADVAVRYIQEIGKMASSYANLANREQCNVFDVIQGLEHLGSVQGFPGASDFRHCLARSGVVKDIIRFVSQADEIPFVYPIPAFPVVRERVLDLSFAQAQETPPEEHIPRWLPKFPDPVTYAELSSANEKGSETEAVKIQQVEKQNRRAERSLLNLQQKFMCNGSEAGAIVEQGDAAKAQRAAENNPFLATPLQSWEKEVSLPSLPARLIDESLGSGYHQSHEVMENHVSITKPSLQASEAARSGPCEPEERKKIPLNGRANVQFKVGNVKKSLGTVTKPQNNGTERTSWFGDDHDEADKKNDMAEKILWGNTEYQPEVSNV